MVDGVPRRLDKTVKNTLSQDNLYGGIKILSPEGGILFRCNEKKANWYLSRELADRKSKDCIILRFKPKGFGDAYLIHPKENVCVVCGKDKELTKHHVVPHSYRRYFPVHFKTHLSHDCVLLCVDCHEKYEEASRERQKVLARRYNVPLRGMESKSNRSAWLGAARALVNHKHKIPQERKEVLWANIKQHLGYIPKEEELKALIESKQKVKTHGELLVLKFTEDRLVGFILGWRKHFVKVMAPNFLPDGWAITAKTHYSEDEFESFKAYESQVKSFQDGVADAKAKLPRRDMSSAEPWVREAYDTGYNVKSIEQWADTNAPRRILMNTPSLSEMFE